MGTKDILLQLSHLRNDPMKIARMGLRINTDDLPIFKNSVDEIIDYVNGIDESKIYRLDIEVSRFMFLSINVTVQYLKPEEMGHPIGLVRVARNIAKFDANYEYSDDHKVWSFWSNLRKNIYDKIGKMDSHQRQIVKDLAGDRAKYFGLI